MVAQRQVCVSLACAIRTHGDWPSCRRPPLRLNERIQDTRLHSARVSVHLDYELARRDAVTRGSTRAGPRKVRRT